VNDKPINGTIVQARPDPLGRRARVDAGVRLASVSALWLSLLLVTYWWETDRGVQDLAGWATGLTSVGRLSGLLASVLLLAQVVLMARVPPLERAFGQDRLARLHRLVGFTSFTLMVFHVVTITWGYAAGRLLATPAMLWQLTVDYPGMLLAAAGTLCLFLVVFTSIKAARRRLRYESWHLLHLYAYLGVGLALPHQLWTGQQFVGSTAKTVFWWTTWALAAAAVLVWRVGQPLLLNLRHRVRVQLGGRRGRGHLVGLPDRPPAGRAPGRGRPVLHLALPVRSGVDPREPVLALRRRRTGAACGSRSRASATGASRPAGSGRAPARSWKDRTAGSPPAPRTRRKVALIGAGVGITPLRALAEGLSYAPWRGDPGRAVRPPAALRPGVRPALPRARAAGVATPRTPTRPGLLAR
jgi:DMSO/TMAO reductase YedYZ heme-binding membrane subunit